MSEQAMGRIGDYEILSVLGAGGMGKVFKVRNVISDRIEAMKVLLPDLAGRQELAERFLREIKVLAGLNHPNIAALRTALTLDNRLVMIMEYVEGVTLAARLEQGGAIATPDAVNYIDQVLAALGYAHQQRVIHRDIKPANMMLTPQGVVKIMDFGIARSANDRGLTATGTTLGSLFYMSPEQVKGQPVDERSDLYSVGVSLYEMVTGQRPFQADSDYSIMAAHLEQAPRPPIDFGVALPAGLNEIILMALAKDPAQRFKTADAFRRALSSVCANLPGTPPEVAAVPVAPAAPAAGASATAVASTAVAAAPVPQAAVAAPAQIQPQAPPVPSAPPPTAVMAGKSHRGLYMTLGALIVLVVLVGAGLYLPRRNQARANEESGSTTPVPTTTQPDTALSPPVAGTDSAAGGPATVNVPAAGGITTPSAGSVTLPAGSGPKSSTTAVSVSGKGKSLAQASTGQSASSSQRSTQFPGAGNDVPVQPPAQSVDPAVLEALQQEDDQLSSRTASVNTGLDNLRRAQAAQGSGLRGDILAAQQRMQNDMGRAHSALQNQDVRGARKYLDLAETEVSNLEKFLGR